MHVSRAEPSGQGKAADPVQHKQREVLVLIVVGVPESELLLAVGGIFAAIEIEDHMSRCFRAGFGEQFDEVFVDQPNAVDLGLALLEDDFAVFEGLVGLSPSVGMMKARDGGAAGQRLLVAGGNADQGLKERIVPGEVRVVEVEVSGEELVDLLTENLADGVNHALLLARIGKAAGQVVEDSQTVDQSCQRQESGIGDNIAASEVDRDLLFADGKQMKLPRTDCFRHSRLLLNAKCFFPKHLDAAEGCFVLSPCAIQARMLSARFGEGWSSG
jgi:hypothetical protein